MYASPESVTLFNAAFSALHSDTDAILITVSATKGSAPRLQGAAMLVTNRSTAATIGGGHLEWIAVQHARTMIAQSSHLHEQRYTLGASAGQCCGGVMQLRYERLNHTHLTELQANTIARQTLYLFGAGHVAQVLVRQLAALPLNIVWVDSRDAVNAYDEPFSSTHAALPAHIQTLLTDMPEAEIAAAKQGSLDRKSTRLNSSHRNTSRMPSSA